MLAAARSAAPLRWRIASVAGVLTLVCAVWIPLMGADRWAEGQLEYFTVYRPGFSARSLFGSNGYVALLPIATAVAFHHLAGRFPSLDFGVFARAVGLSFLTLSVVETFRQLQPALGRRLAALVALLLAAQLLHPSTASFINVACAGFTPLALWLLTALMEDEGWAALVDGKWKVPRTAAALFVIATLSKASFLALVMGGVLLWPRRTRGLASLLLLLAAAQLLFMNTLGLGTSTKLAAYDLPVLAMSALEVTGVFLASSVWPSGPEITHWEALGWLFLTLSGAALLLLGAGASALLQRARGGVRVLAVTLMLAAIELPTVLNIVFYTRGHPRTWNQAVGASAFATFNWFKQQYLLFAVPILLVSLLCAFRLRSPGSLGRRRGLLVAGALLALVSLGAHARASTSSTVSAALSLPRQFRALHYWDCYLNPPLPAWSRASTARVAVSSWAFGGCPTGWRYAEFAPDGSFVHALDGNAWQALRAHAFPEVTVFFMLHDPAGAVPELCVHAWGSSCSGPARVALTSVSAEGYRYAQQVVTVAALDAWSAQHFAAVDTRAGRAIEDAQLNVLVLMPAPR